MVPKGVKVGCSENLQLTLGYFIQKTSRLDGGSILPLFYKCLWDFDYSEDLLPMLSYLY